MAVSGTIEGFDKVFKRLKELEPKVAKKVLRQALRAGAKIIQTRAKANAPVLTGQTKKAIKIRAGKRSRGSVGVNVSIGARDYVGDQFYAAFHEYGTSKMQARPFMRPAYDSEKEKAAEVIQRKILEGIEAVA